MGSRPLLFGLAALVWLAFRTGRKPARIAYPCQQAALSGVSLAWLLVLAPAVHGAARWTWRRKARLAAAGGLLSALVFGGASDTSLGQSRAPSPLRGAANYVADVFVVEHAGGPAGDHHPGIDRLVTGMAAAGLKFYRSPVPRAESGPDGIVHADDVVLIKINGQWPERGGTNTDVLQGLIARILEHPDGFTGEVVVVENGQGAGSFDWPASNAADPGQSVLDVVNHFASLGQPVSSYLWDSIRDNPVGEYGDGDTEDGYVVGPWNDASAIRVSYPKFRTAGGHYVSLKQGLWDPEAGAYDGTRLRFLSVPVLKCHGAYGVTASVKLHVGTMTTALSTYTHSAVASGGLGSFLAEVRMPDLNILDCTWILADPNKGPGCSYADATWTDMLAASRDPVALDIWSVANLLVPTMIENGFTQYPNQDPFEPNSDFRHYLDLSANRLLAAGIPVTEDLSHILTHVVGTTGVDSDTTLRPTGAFPNPSGSTTSLRFVAGRSGTARLDIYDLTGRLRRSIRASVQQGAMQELRWDGADQDGRAMSPGTYYYRLGGAGVTATGKITRVR